MDDTTSSITIELVIIYYIEIHITPPPSNVLLFLLILLYSMFQKKMRNNSTTASRCLVFAVAFLSFIVVPRHQYVAEGFLISDVPSLPLSLSSSLSLSLSCTTATATTSASRKEIISNCNGSTTISQGRIRTTHLFSQPSSTTASTTTTPSSAAAEQQPKSISISPPLSPSTSPSSSIKKTTKAAIFASKSSTTDGPDLETKPDYENIHGPLGKTLDDLFLTVFRTKLAHYVGVDSKLPKTDYGGIIELSAALNSRYSDRGQVQKIAQQTLCKLC